MKYKIVAFLTDEYHKNNFNADSYQLNGKWVFDIKIYGNPPTL